MDSEFFKGINGEFIILPNPPNENPDISLTEVPNQSLVPLDQINNLSVREQMANHMSVVANSRQSTVSAKENNPNNARNSHKVLAVVRRHQDQLYLTQDAKGKQTVVQRCKNVAKLQTRQRDEHYYPFDLRARGKKNTATVGVVGSLSERPNYDDNLKRSREQMQILQTIRSETHRPVQYEQEQKEAEVRRLKALAKNERKMKSYKVDMGNSLEKSSTDNCQYEFVDLTVNERRTVDLDSDSAQSGDNKQALSNTTSHTNTFTGSNVMICRSTINARTNVGPYDIDQERGAQGTDFDALDVLNGLDIINDESNIYNQETIYNRSDSDDDGGDELCQRDSVSIDRHCPGVSGTQHSQYRHQRRHPPGVSGMQQSQCIHQTRHSPGVSGMHHSKGKHRIQENSCAMSHGNKGQRKTEHNSQRLVKIRCMQQLNMESIIVNTAEARRIEAERKAEEDRQKKLIQNEKKMKSFGVNMGYVLAGTSRTKVNNEEAANEENHDSANNSLGIVALRKTDVLGDDDKVESKAMSSEEKNRRRNELNRQKMLEARLKQQAHFNKHIENTAETRRLEAEKKAEQARLKALRENERKMRSYKVTMGYTMEDYLQDADSKVEDKENGDVLSNESQINDTLCDETTNSNTPVVKQDGESDQDVRNGPSVFTDNDFTPIGTELNTSATNDISCDATDNSVVKQDGESGQGVRNGTRVFTNNVSATLADDCKSKINPQEGQINRNTIFGEHNKELNERCITSQEASCPETVNNVKIERQWNDTFEPADEVAPVTNGMVNRNGNVIHNKDGKATDLNNHPQPEEFTEEQRQRNCREQMMLAIMKKQEELDKLIKSKQKSQDHQSKGKVGKI